MQGVYRSWASPFTLLQRRRAVSHKMATARPLHMLLCFSSALPAQLGARTGHLQNNHPHCLRQLPVLNPQMNPQTLKGNSLLKTYCGPSKM